MFQNETLRDLPSMYSHSIRIPSYLSFLFLLTYLVTNARSVRIMGRGGIGLESEPSPYKVNFNMFSENKSHSFGQFVSLFTALCTVMLTASANAFDFEYRIQDDRELHLLE